MVVKLPLIVWFPVKLFEPVVAFEPVELLVITGDPLIVSPPPVKLNPDPLVKLIEPDEDPLINTIVAPSINNSFHGLAAVPKVPFTSAGIILPDTVNEPDIITFWFKFVTYEAVCAVWTYEEVCAVWTNEAVWAFCTNEAVCAVCTNEAVCAVWTYEAVVANEELIAFCTNEAVCAVCTNEAVCAVWTYEAVCAVWTNEAVCAVPCKEPVIPAVTINDPVSCAKPVNGNGDPPVPEVKLPSAKTYWDPAPAIKTYEAVCAVPCKDPVNDPLNPCAVIVPVFVYEPVKYSKLPSISVIVRGEPFICLNVKFAILFIYKY